MDKIKDAGAEILTAVADLVVATKNAIFWGVEKAKVGVDYTAEGIKSIWEGAKDPGAPNTKLKIYDEKYLDSDFDFPPSNNSQLYEALELHSKLLFLNFKTDQYITFMEPAVTEYETVSETVKTIRSNKVEFSDEIADLEKRIGEIDTMFKGGHISEDTDRGINLMTEKRDKAAELAGYKEMCSFKVNWAKPEYHVFDFPPGSGKQKKRLVPHPTDTTEIDLEKYEKILSDYLSKYKAELGASSFKDEKEKLAYHRDKIIEGVLQDLEKATKNGDAIGAGTIVMQKVEFENKKAELDDKVGKKTHDFSTPLSVEDVRFTGISSPAPSGVFPLPKDLDALNKLP